MSQDPANGSGWRIMWLCPFMMVATLGMQLKLTLQIEGASVEDLTQRRAVREMLAYDRGAELLSDACPYVLGVRWIKPDDASPSVFALASVFR